MIKLISALLVGVSGTMFYCFALGFKTLRAKHKKKPTDDWVILEAAERLTFLEILKISYWFGFMGVFMLVIAYFVLPEL